MDKHDESIRRAMELAAKAAGITILKWEKNLYGSVACIDDREMSPTGYWQPLIDDGDAFRLVVKLNMQLEIPARGSCKIKISGAYRGDGAYLDEEFNRSRRFGTRWAILRAAADLGLHQ